MLAKQLVQLRKQKQRTYVASSQITAAGYTAKAMGANVRIAEAMGETSKTMGQGGSAADLSLDEFFEESLTITIATRFLDSIVSKNQFFAFAQSTTTA